jgi:predicted nucleic acid-binding protein
MSDKMTFVDSNVILYLFTDDNKRKEFVKKILSGGYAISTQVVNENVNVCLRKLRLSKEEAYAHGKNLINVFTVFNISISTIASAFDLSSSYKFSYWDSLIVASALENVCDILLSEDMQHGLLVEGKLKTQNPFLSL